MGKRLSPIRGNSVLHARSSASGQLCNVRGKLGSMLVRVRSSMAAISVGGRAERTASTVSLSLTSCVSGKNMAGCGSSVKVLYFPSSTTDRIVGHHAVEGGVPVPVVKVVGIGLHIPAMFLVFDVIEPLRVRNVQRAHDQRIQDAEDHDVRSDPQSQSQDGR